MSKEVTIIGPNPAIDILHKVKSFKKDQPNSVETGIEFVGGKPLNLARAIHELDYDAHVTVLSPIGGRTGLTIQSECMRIGILIFATRIAGMNRTNQIYVDVQTGRSTELNEQGPQLSDDEVDSYQMLVYNNLQNGKLLLGSGSLSPGLPRDFYAEIAFESKERDIRFIADISKEALREVLKERPFAIKINGDELMAVVDAQTPQAAAERLVYERRVKNVIVTMGKEGAFYRGEEGVFTVSAPRIELVNPTGAGDAFLAAVAVGIMDGRSWRETLRFASSVGALCASRFAQDVGENPYPDIEKLEQDVVILESRMI